MFAKPKPAVAEAEGVYTLLWVQRKNTPNSSEHRTTPAYCCANTAYCCIPHHGTTTAKKPNFAAPFTNCNWLNPTAPRFGLDKIPAPRNFPSTSSQKERQYGRWLSGDDSSTVAVRPWGLLRAAYTYCRKFVYPPRESCSPDHDARVGRRKPVDVLARSEVDCDARACKRRRDRGQQSCSGKYLEGNHPRQPETPR